jgi:hypothetical protein
MLSKVKDSSKGRKKGTKSEDNSDNKKTKTSPKGTAHLSPLEFIARPFQQPWMFIPEYLEVNFNTCSAVFVRPPMVKPGKCEIPSPFPPDVHGLAHEYYSK